MKLLLLSLLVVSLHAAKPKHDTCDKLLARVIHDYNKSMTVKTPQSRSAYSTRGLLGYNLFELCVEVTDLCESKDIAKAMKKIK